MFGKKTLAKVADVVVETLLKAGVKRVYGVAGDSLNGLTDSIRAHNGIDWLMVRHEEVAAFAAGGESQITGELTHFGLDPFIVTGDSGAVHPPFSAWGYAKERCKDG